MSWLGYWRGGLWDGRGRFEIELKSVIECYRKSFGHELVAFGRKLLQAVKDHYRILVVCAFNNYSLSHRPSLRLQPELPTLSTP